MTNILLIEDSATLLAVGADALRTLVRDGGRVKAFPGWVEAIPFIQWADLVVADWVLEGFNADTCEDAIHRLIDMRKPFIIWTANRNSVPPKFDEYIVGKDLSELTKAVKSAMRLQEPVTANGADK